MMPTYAKVLLGAYAKKMRDGRERVTWFAVKDVMLRTNKCVYKKLTEGGK